MRREPDMKESSKAKLSNIVDMGLGFSGMIRLFKQGEKEKLHQKLLSVVQKVFEAESEQQFREIHSSFCEWGTENITLAKKRSKASYGQIAKTLNVVLKVVVYYCHLPDCEMSQQISRWLDAAVDTKMMEYLKERYREAIKPWPTAIEHVHESDYREIQKVVHKHVKEKHEGKITPVQFDDIYWEALNR
jgi:hypothetical protein